MRIYVLAVSMTVVHLLAGGVGSVIITNLVSSTGVATYGGPSGFVPGEDPLIRHSGSFSMATKGQLRRSQARIPEASDWPGMG